MAKFRQSISDYLPGSLAVTFVTVVIICALFTLWLFAYQHGESEVNLDPYLQHVLFFTFYQAIISTLLSLALAIIVAKSLLSINFKGKSFLLNCYSLTFALPSLVVITGLLSVYGTQGIIANICHYFELNYSLSLYGIKGILMAHVFFNFPLTTKIYYQSLLLIPNEQKKLAQQLNFNLWQSFKYLEWPIVAKQLLPMGGLIFMFCFSSFATVLTLGGSPKYTTIEVAIYQAIRDFELSQAVVLSFVQLLFCIGFMLLLRLLTPKHSPQLIANKEYYIARTSLVKKGIAVIVILMSAVYILSPLLAIILDTICYFSTEFISFSLIQSLLTSFIVALCSAILAMILALSILWTNSRLRLVGQTLVSDYLLFLGSLILAIPNMVLSVGCFLLFISMTDVPGFIFVLVVVSNALLALPFILRNLATPLVDLTKRYQYLALSLNITGLNYLYIVEFRALRQLFTYSFAFACVISLGDFGIIALFGSQDFMTLPYYLFELVSHYRYQEASFSALILLITSYLLINSFERTP